MAEKALADISSEQTSVAGGDLFFVEKAGVPAKVTFQNLMKNSFANEGTITITGTVNFTGGTVTFADGQITGAKMAAATLTTRGSVELATTAETRTGTDETRAVTPKGLADTALARGQAWQDMTASRAVSTTYTNSTGRPIFVAITIGAGSAPDIEVSPGGGGWLKLLDNAGTPGGRNSVVFPVQHGDNYRVVGGSVPVWLEFR